MFRPAIGARLRSRCCRAARGRPAIRWWPSASAPAASSSAATRRTFHADRRPGLQHRGRGRGQPRLEARRRSSKGRAPPRLLDSYDAERRPLARAQHRVREGLRRFARPLRAGAGDRGRDAGRRSAREPRRRVPRRARPRRVQHPGHHLRRPLRRLADRRADGTTPPPTGRTSTCRPRAPAGGRRTCGSPTAARCSTAFGLEWTLLQLGDQPQGTGFERAAQRLGLDLDGVRV